MLPKGSDNVVKASGIMIQSESSLKLAMPGTPDHTDRSQMERTVLNKYSRKVGIQWTTHKF